MLELIDGLPDNVAAFDAQGEVTEDDYQSVLIPTVDRVREQYGKVRCMYVLGEEFVDNQFRLGRRGKNTEK